MSGEPTPPLGLGQGLPPWKHRWAGSRAAPGNDPGDAACRQPLGIMPPAPPTPKPWVPPPAGVLTAAPPQPSPGTRAQPQQLQQQQLKRRFGGPAQVAPTHGTSAVAGSRLKGTTQLLGHLKPNSRGAVGQATAGGRVVATPGGAAMMRMATALERLKRQQSAAPPAGTSYTAYQGLSVRGRAMPIHPASAQTAASAASVAGAKAEASPEVTTTWQTDSLPIAAQSACNQQHLQECTVLAAAAPASLPAADAARAAKAVAVAVPAGPPAVGQGGAAEETQLTSCDVAATQLGIRTGLQTHLTIAEQLLEQYGLLDTYRATLADTQARTSLQQSTLRSTAGLSDVGGATGASSGATSYISAASASTPLSHVADATPEVSEAGTGLATKVVPSAASTAAAAAAAAGGGAAAGTAGLVATLSSLSSIDSFMSTFKADGSPGSIDGQAMTLRGGWPSAGGASAAASHTGSIGGTAVPSTGLLTGMMCTVRNPLYRLQSEAASSVASRGSSNGIGRRSPLGSGDWWSIPASAATTGEVAEDAEVAVPEPFSPGSRSTHIVRQQQQQQQQQEEEDCMEDDSLERGRSALQWLASTVPGRFSPGDTSGPAAAGAAAASFSTLPGHATAGSERATCVADTGGVPFDAVVTGASDAMSVNTGELEALLLHESTPNLRITTRMDAQGAQLLQHRPIRAYGGVTGADGTIVEVDEEQELLQSELKAASPLPGAVNQGALYPQQALPYDVAEAAQPKISKKAKKKKGRQAKLPTEDATMLAPGALVYEYLPPLLASLRAADQQQVAAAAEGENAELVQQLGTAQRLLASAGLLPDYQVRSQAVLLGSAAILSAASSSTPTLPEGEPGPNARPWVSTAAGKGRTGHYLDVTPVDPEMEKRTVWQPPHPSGAPVPLETVWSPVGVLLFLCYLAAMVYYFIVRVRYSLDLGYQLWYGILVLVVEGIGVTAVLPYGLMLIRYTRSTRSPGLPRDDGRVVLPSDKRFHVRILVPCYKESLGIIQATVGAALDAAVPPGCHRTVYLCDDGNKTCEDTDKRRFIASLGADAVYVCGRQRAKGEINGKSSNLNNCLKNVIYAGIKDPADIPPTELLVVFDADMVAKPNFLLKVLEVMWDDTNSLCLTPQSFTNIPPAADLFNAINPQFWEVVLPGCDALGYVGCTGTNFCIRVPSLATVGFFPEYTITEDYALSMELKAAGFKGRYLPEYLAAGEAPAEVRDVMRQRSRWCKGHAQVFFSKRCPLFHPKLTPLYWVLYTNGTWAYFTTIITTIMFVAIPFVSLVCGWHPVAFSLQLTLASTVYLVAGAAVSFWVPGLTRQRLLGMYMSAVCNHLLTPTYAKAVINTLLSVLGLKAVAGFKATEKKVQAAVVAVSAVAASLRESMTATFRGMTHTLRRTGAPLSTIREHNATAGSTGSGAGSTQRRSATAQSSAAVRGSSAGGAGPSSSAGATLGSSISTLGTTGGTTLSAAGSVQSTAARPVGEGVEVATSVSTDAQAAINSGDLVLEVYGPDGRLQLGSNRAATVAAAAAASGSQPPAEPAEGPSAAAPRAGSVAASSDAVIDMTSAATANAGLSTDATAKVQKRRSTKTAKQQQQQQQQPTSSPRAAQQEEEPEPGMCGWFTTNWRANWLTLDMWMLLLSLCISGVALTAGAWGIAQRGNRFAFAISQSAAKVFITGHMDEFMLLAMVWAAYNLLPALLFWIYMFNKGQLLQAASSISHLLSGLLLAGAITLLWLLVPVSYDLPQALSLSAGFLDAQRAFVSGNSSSAVPSQFQLPPAAASTYPWLQGQAALDPSGVSGFYMKGSDYVKYTFPQAHAMTLLAWGLLSFSAGTATVPNSLQAQLQATLLHGTQYLLAAATTGPGQLLVQVGDPADYYSRDPGTKPGFWGLPADMPSNRNATIVYANASAAADVFASTTAALAAASLALAAEQPYTAQLALDAAVELYASAVAVQPAANTTHCSLMPCQGWAPSNSSSSSSSSGQLVWSGFPSSTALDDMAWAAAWLHKATRARAAVGKGTRACHV